MTEIGVFFPQHIKVHLNTVYSLAYTFKLNFCEPVLIRTLDYLFIYQHASLIEIIGLESYIYMYFICSPSFFNRSCTMRCSQTGQGLRPTGMQYSLRDPSLKERLVWFGYPYNIWFWHSNLSCLGNILHCWFSFLHPSPHYPSSLQPPPLHLLPLHPSPFTTPLSTSSLSTSPPSPLPSPPPPLPKMAAHLPLPSRSCWTWAVGQESSACSLPVLVEQRRYKMAVQNGGRGWLMFTRLRCECQCDDVWMPAPEWCEWCVHAIQLGIPLNMWLQLTFLSCTWIRMPTMSVMLIYI